MLLPNYRGVPMLQLVVAATNPALAGLGRPGGDFKRGGAQNLRVRRWHERNLMAASPPCLRADASTT
jgi:hypothetical protein